MGQISNLQLVGSVKGNITQNSSETMNIFIFRKTNQTIDSERMLKRCIYLDPKFIPAYIELARLRGARDRSVGSLLRAIVQINPVDPNYITIYGHWLLNKGKLIPK